MRTWKLEEAKNRFSELVRRAVAHEPQIVTKHGREAVVLLSVEDYRGLTTPQDLVGFLRNSPLAEVLADEDLDLTRTADTGREIDL